jgi:hypothetical protein
MHITTLLNLIANSLLICSSVHLLFKIFGNKDSKVWQKPYAAVLYKAVMATTICGAAANIITLSTPSWSEIILNLGASGNWLFLSFYLYGYSAYTPNSSTDTTLHKPKPASRTSRAAKVKPNPSSSSKRGKRVAT